jgi:hypothetical protein
MSTYPVAHCQHIKKDGSPCGSPALRNHQFCYFHHRCRPLLPNVDGSAAFPPAPFFLPTLDDRDSIQRALGKVCDHLLHRRLDPKKAGALLYAIQLASLNLPGRNQNKIRENRFQK